MRDRLQVTRVLADWRRVLANDVGRQSLAHVRSLDSRTHRETDGSVTEDRTLGGPKVREVIIARPCVVEVLVECLVASSELALELTSY